MPSPRIALAQIDTRVGDVDANAQAVLDWARDGRRGRRRPGGLPRDDADRLPHRGPRAARVVPPRGRGRAAAHRGRRWPTRGSGDLAVLVGTVGEKSVTPVHEPGAPEGPRRPTNQAVLLQHGQVQVRYDKHHLPNYGVFDEYRIFAPGDDVCVIDVAGPPGGRRDLRGHLAGRRTRLADGRERGLPAGGAQRVAVRGGQGAPARRARRPPRARGRGARRVREPRRRAGRPRVRRRLVRHRHRRHAC